MTKLGVFIYYAFPMTELDGIHFAKMPGGAQKLRLRSGLVSTGSPRDSQQQQLPRFRLISL
jgi:hypothetical protein